jgi:hypothetical protein
MKHGFPLAASLVGMAAILGAGRAEALACGDVAGAVPATVIVAAPEMRTPQASARCTALSAQAFVDRLRAMSATASAPGAYVPRTKDDNTPWRFDMTQNGKRMTAEEFDAWMQAKGIRVAKGRAPAPAAPPAASQSNPR